MAVSDSASEAIWLNRLHAELTLKPHKPLLIYIDSTGSMSLAHNPRHHDRTKHIDVRHHFIREATENGHVELQHVSSEKNTADVLTKPLPQPLHELHTSSMGVKGI
jgi:cellulose biosynthesis protein BcsQ